MAMEMNEVDQAFAGLGGNSGAGGGGEMAAVDDAFAGLGSEPAGVAPPVKQAQGAAPSRFHSSARPSAASEPELSWGETGRQAIKNLVPSTVEAGKAMVGALSHPVDTLTSLRDLGIGGLSQAAGALGMEQDPAAKAEREKLINALERHYGETYGSAKGFKRALAQDPASILMDASTFLGGVGAAGKAAGLTKAAKVAATASKLTDPIQLALKGAAQPLKIVKKVTPYVQSATTGASVDSLVAAAKAGAEKDPAMRKVFEAHRTGAANPSDAVDAVEQAIKSKADRRSAEYVAAQQKLFGGNLPSLSWNPILSAYKKARDSITNKRTGTIVLNSKAGEAMKEINQALYDFRQSGARTVEDFDDLKKKIGDIRSQYGADAQANRVATEMYQSVVESIAQKHPEYKDIMKRYGDASDELFQLKQTYGIGKKVSDESILRRLLSHGKSKNKQNLLQELAAENPAIPYMLAGQELHKWTPGGIQGIGHLVTAGLYGANPLGLAAQGISASPRLMGKMNYNLGRVERNVARATQPGMTKGAYYAGRAQEENQPQEEISAPVDGDVAAAIRGAEGTAQNPDSTARDAYQMIDSTFIDQFKKAYPERAAGMSDQEIIALRRTPEGSTLAEQLGPNLINENSAGLQRAGIDPTPGNVYLAHFLGLTGALRVLNAPPETPVSELVSDQAIQANPGLLQGKTAGEVIASMGSIMARNDRMGRASGGSVNRVDALTAKLMLKAKRAKIAADKTTEPLLNEPDHAVVKALDVAQQAI